MILALSLLHWWYGEGLTKQISKSRERIASMVDFFSIPLLIKTLFNPYKQISAGRVRGPIGVQIQALLDKLFSRLVGAAIRSLTIILGLFALLYSISWNTLRLGLWLILPAMPIVSLFLALTGWVPWKL